MSNAKSILDQAHEAIEQWSRATPGPWVAPSGRGGCVDAGRDQVALATGNAPMHGDPARPAHEIVAANAAAIAAARTREPALAEALLTVTGILEKLLRDVDHWDEDERVAAINLAEKALADLIGGTRG